MKEDKQTAHEIVSLDRAKPGDNLEVVAVNRGHRAVQRLMHMGLVPGSRLVVETVHPFRGPIVVSINGTRIAIGRKLAKAIEAAVI